MATCGDAEVFPQPDRSDSRRSRLARPWRRILTLFSTHNPFYLLSTAFLLHGSALWMQSTGGHETRLLIGLISAYVLMMAITAITIVRAGGVWDDARSILLVIPALFVELSLTLDNSLLVSRPQGTASVMGGFLFAACVTEGLLWGLRIRLSVFFRLPLHAFLGILFLYPLAIVPAIESGQVATASWRIFLFYPVVAILLLTLLPAVRRGPAAVSDNGTPWRWPWFPWTLLGVLVAGVCIRGYALGLSFDPVLSLGTDAAMRLPSAWGSYFLVPVLLAIAVLVVEAGIAAASRAVQAIGLALPAVCVLLALPWGPTLGPHADFLAEFTRRAGSPLMLTLIVSAVFYAVAWWRRVPWAEPALVATLLLLTFASPRTLGPTRLFETHPLGLLAVGGVLMVSGMWKRDSRRTLLAALLWIAAITVGPLALGPGWVQGFVPVQLTLLSVFVVGRIFNDAFA